MSNNSLYINIYKGLLPTLFKVLIFFTPLIFITGTNEIFEFPKTYFVYLIGSTTIWLFLIKVIIENKKIRLPDLLITGFFGVYLISTLFSSHFLTSVWGYYTRFNGGLFSLAVLIGIYIVLKNEFKNKQILQLISTGSLAVFPIGVYAIIQHFGLTAGVWKGDPTVRAFSTLGQPNWLGAYMAMYLPFIFAGALGLVENDRMKENSRTYNFILFIIAFAALWFTYSVSSLLAFVIGTAYFVFLNTESIIRNKKMVSILFALCIFIAVMNPGIFSKKVRDVFKDINKITANFFTAYAQEGQLSDPGFIRSYLWAGTFDLILSSPKNFLIGTGPETFAYEFQQFRPLSLNTSSEWNLVFNKPHNYYLELWSNIGIFGFVIYLLIAIKSLKAKHNILTPALAGFYVSSFFGWPTITTALLFWIFLLGTQKDA